MLRSALAAAALLLAPFASQALAVPSSSPAAAASPPQSIATYCPRAIHRATRLIVVTVPQMASVKATLHTFERRSPADATWMRAGPPEAAVVGDAGIGWSEDFDYLAKKDEPVKREGDKRTPAGIFRVAGPFGFEPNKIRGYTKLESGRSFCVDDPTSLLYGRIVSKELAAKVKSAEDMSTVPGLKRALMVDYPARRGAKAGSCIFVHVWDGAEKGTNARDRHAGGARRGAAEVERRGLHGHRHRQRGGGAALQELPAAQRRHEQERTAGGGSRAQSAPHQGPARRAGTLGSAAPPRVK